MKIAVLPNLDKKGSAQVVEKLGVFLKKEKIEAYLPDNIFGTDFLHLPEEKLYKTADIIITIGGDGTIMRYAKRAALDDKPVLGINAGRMGYLADIEQNELDLMEKLIAGEYRVEERMMLCVKVLENEKEIARYTALNDAVITSGFIARIIDISAGVGDDFIHYRADGLILSTPTGSTAYSMSAGGPIIDPLTDNFCITPICSHSLSAKPILLGAGNRVRLKASSKKRTDIFLTLDGRKVCSVRPFTEIIVEKAEKSAKLIRLNNRSFYKTLSTKFKDGRSM